MPSRQVQKVPPPACVRPRSARWKAWLWVLARPGTTRPRTGIARGGSVSGSVAFDPELAARLAGLGGWPVIPTQAGHDAGILSDAGIPTAMVFVRNPTGVSHAPDEHAETADCLAGVEALADVLADLAGHPA